MLRITRKANGEVVFKVSGQLNSQNVAEIENADRSGEKGESHCPGLDRFEVGRWRGRQVSGEVGSRFDQAEELRPLHSRVDSQATNGKTV